MGEKTIKEWFQALPEPMRSQALKNADNRNAKESSLAQAILGGFGWSESAEGVTYWVDIKDRAESGEFDKPKPLDENDVSDLFEE